MKTRCPDCQTTFRVTPDQLKARAGKVRCGQCQRVFNALDSLLDDGESAAPPAAAPIPVAPAASEVPAPPRVRDEPLAPAHAPGDKGAEAHPLASPTLPPPDALEDWPRAADDEESPPDEAALTASEADTQERGKAAGLILPRATNEIPGYSKWNEGPVAETALLPVEKTARWPFVVAAVLLTLALAGQAAFRFRSEIAVTTPALRPALEALSHAFDTDVPLPRHVELVSIEASDLQSDPARGNLLVLNATLRNRAGYGLAYPSLELSLTDTQDVAIVRRVFTPTEYLPAGTRADQPFAAKSDLAVRLWIEVLDVSAAGYRLYVFYP
jgi:predicted Zn finger-like uncharacterized protein